MALEFVAGALGGAAGIVVGQPFDTLKVLQQTQASGHGTSLWTTFRQSVSTNGYIGLFDGLATPLLGVYRSLAVAVKTNFFPALT